MKRTFFEERLLLYSQLAGWHKEELKGHYCYTEFEYNNRAKNNTMM